MMDPVTMHGDRLSLANSALYEISCLSSVVKTLDTDGEEIAQVLPAMMARLRKLSESVSRLLDKSPLEHEEAPEIWETINCRPPTRQDVAGLIGAKPESGASS